MRARNKGHNKMNFNETSIDRQSKVEEVDFSALKILILTFLSVAASMAMIYEFSAFSISLNYLSLWLGLSALFIFTVLNILNAFFIKHIYMLAGIAFLETCLPIVFYPNQIFSINMVGFLLFFAFVLYGLLAGRNHLMNSIKIRFFSVVSLITPKIVTGALICMSMLFFTNCLSYGNGVCTESFGKSIVNNALDASTPIVNIWIPGVSADQTVSDFFNSFAISQMSKVKLGDGFPENINLSTGISEIPKLLREKIINKFSSDIRSAFEQTTGPLDSNKSVKSEVFRIISEYVKKFSDKTKAIASIGLAVLIFFSLKGIAFLTYWLVNLVAFLVYKLLIAANFAVVNYETRNREFVVLP